MVSSLNKITQSNNLLKKSVYLLHFYVISVFNEYFGLINYKTSIIYRLGMPFIVIPITIIIVALIRKLRLGKKVLP